MYDAGGTRVWVDDWSGYMTGGNHFVVFENGTLLSAYTDGDTMIANATSMIADGSAYWLPYTAHESGGGQYAEDDKGALLDEYWTGDENDNGGVQMATPPDGVDTNDLPNPCAPVIVG